VGEGRVFHGEKTYGTLLLVVTAAYIDDSFQGEVGKFFMWKKHTEHRWWQPNS